MTGAAHHRGESKQDFETPPELIAAVVHRFGPLHYDLAARGDNTKAPRFITPETNSLVVPWDFPHTLSWLNPPFADIAPWAAKCSAVSAPGQRVLLLTPASVGSNWWAAHVHNKARVLFLNGRIKFVGAAQGYPKDCCLSVFGPGVVPGYEVWRWPDEVRS